MFSKPFPEFILICVFKCISTPWIPGMYTLRVDCTPSLHTLVYDLTKQVRTISSLMRIGVCEIDSVHLILPHSFLPFHPSSLLCAHACRLPVQRQERRGFLCTTAGIRGTTGRTTAMHRGTKPHTRLLVLVRAQLFTKSSQNPTTITTLDTLFVLLSLFQL